jgi:K+-transporting ATPase ATPase C chain
VCACVQTLLMIVLPSAIVLCFGEVIGNRRQGWVLYAGSRLVGPAWQGPEWFHGRPSATNEPDPTDPTIVISAPYNAENSAGSNFGPTSKDLSERLSRDRKALEAMQPELAGAMLPAEMLTTSASGLDPEISPANAALQVVTRD